MPQSAAGPTALARLSPVQARWLLVLTGTMLAGAVAITLSPLASSNLKPRPGKPNDVALYLAMVRRVHDGQGYYQASAAEMTARGYPTRSVFNWRTPLPLWLLGKLPRADFGKAILGLIGVAIMVMAFEAMARESARSTSDSRLPVNSPSPPAPLPQAGEGRASTLLCVLLLTGALMPMILGDLFVMPELWAGALVALSVCAYGIGRPWIGVATGLAALFFRELALPYCLVSAALAWHGHKRRELLAWLVGVAAWMAFLGLHCWRVQSLVAPNAIAHRHGWLCFGGAAFVISTAQMNAYLLLLPQWATAVYLVAALLGFAGWSTPLGTRAGLSACVFLVAFAFVGQGFNQYWGSLIALLLCFGVARAPQSVGDLCRAAIRPPCGSANHGLTQFSDADTM